VNSFAEFNRYTNTPIARYKSELYNLPFNMNTFHQLWGVKTPDEAKKKINEQIKKYSHIKQPKNLEEQALVLCGDDIYQKLIKGYTEKQWGRSPRELPSFIIKRLPFRFNFDNNYFNDIYQGIPIGGYTQIIEKMLNGIDLQLETNFFENREYFENISDKILFTGKIDEFFNYRFGKLNYRSLKFENEILKTPNFQGNAVVNYTDVEVPFTRIIEHKHFEFGKQPTTYISREYPTEYDGSNEPYYPVNNEVNQNIFNNYKKLSKSYPNIIFGGRLAEYKYYDMHQIVARALKFSKEES
jgi:UDP-galactopyranose mutase